MSEILAQRPVFESLERYLPNKDLLSLIRVDKRLWNCYHDDVLICNRKCCKNEIIACKYGRLDVVKLIYERRGKSFPNYKNSRYNYDWINNNKDKLGKDAYKWFVKYEMGNRYLTNMIGNAAKYGHLHIIKWLFDTCNKSSLYYTDDAMNEAAKKGYYEIVKLLHENGMKITHTSLEKAAENGHYQIVKFLQKNISNNYHSCPLLNRNVNVHYIDMDNINMDKVAKNGHLKIIKYLYRHGHKPSRYAMDEAAGNGHLEVLKWLHKRRHKFINRRLNRRRYYYRYSLQNAAWGGHFEVVKWLHQHTKAPTVDAINYAARNGHLDILKFLNKNRPDAICSYDDLIDASENGHLDVVKYLCENFFYPDDEQCIINATQSGHLDIITFFHEQQYPVFSASAMNIAAANGHLDIVKYLHENRTEGCTTYAMDFAAENGHLDIVKYLHENRTEGCTTYAMDFAAENGHLDIVKYLHENRTEGCTTYAMDIAAVSGRFDIVKYLHKNRTEGCTQRAIYTKNPEIKQYIIEHNCYINGHSQLMVISPLSRKINKFKSYFGIKKKEITQVLNPNHRERFSRFIALHHVCYRDTYIPGMEYQDTDDYSFNWWE